MVTRQPADLLEQIDPARLPPLASWNPPCSGTMDLCIARDGTWYHEGWPIVRRSLVRLFATLLRREADGDYYLVTPVEKWRIRVDDVPFRAVALTITGSGREQQLDFRTDFGEPVPAGPAHPIEVEYPGPGDEPAPYVQVRDGLRARLTRAVFLELAERAEQREESGAAVYGVWTRGAFFMLGPAE
ncbi:MAG: DUF1285 domain-containing protein [Candidatus Competibacterales bacterium]|nr:DUF1285 domain-containing protein [Candidatus Competibacterales bacterium]